MALDIRTIITSINRILNLPRSKAPDIPTPTILLSENRPGLSSIAIANRIIKRKSEAGIPIQPLPDGTPSKDDMMIRIMVEEIIKAIQEEAKISVAVRANIQATGGGTAADGTPVTVTTTTVTLGNGNGIIQ
jgi:hypothetical protein